MRTFALSVSLPGLLVFSACGSGVGSPIRAAAANIGPMADAGDRNADAALPSDAGAVSGEVPATSHCAPVALWPPDQRTAEDKLVALINGERSMPFGGGGGGMRGCGNRSFVPLAPLQVSGALRCSARLHTRDMLQRHYFSEVDQDGIDPGTRIVAAGGPAGPWGEAIERDYTEPAQVLAALMARNEGCQALTSSEFTVVGVGYTSQTWTLDFAGP